MVVMEKASAWRSQSDKFLRHAARPLIVVLGPTASGKTALSIELARHLQMAEVVNADSRQLYRGLSIGTAKISAAEMQGIPHHLLDVLDPDEPLTAAWYKQQAVEVIDDILARKGIPILVGGSMLYISAVIDDLSFAPASDPVLREELSTAYDVNRGGALFKRLQELDPEAAQGIDPRNKPYFIRALEICLATEGPLKEQKEKGECPYDLLLFGIDRPREELHRRIAERTKAMLGAGWIEEVQQLLKDGYDKKSPAMQSHGYREIVAYLHGGMTREELEEQINAKARQYVKRQMTWWKRDPRIQWITLPA
jgi:tRNA dimethylallyltransferase